MATPVTTYIDIVSSVKYLEVKRAAETEKDAESYKQRRNDRNLPDSRPPEEETSQCADSCQIFTQRRSIAKNVGCFQWHLFVCVWACLCVCQHNNFRTSKHRMTKLWGS